MIVIHPSHIDILHTNTMGLKLQYYASLLIAVASKFQTVLAEIPSDSISFPSTVIPQVGDVSLRPKQSNHPTPRVHLDLDRLKIRHSHIDRDLIDFDSSDRNDDLSFDLFDNIHHEPIQNLWKSPMEQIAPLDSKSHYDPVNIVSEFTHAPTTINNEPQHNHRMKRIDQSLQNNLQLKTRKTGTTITALLACNSTVLILAADTRATDGSTVADSNCEKLHQLAKNIWCAGAGTSGDVEAMVRSIKFIFWKRGLLNEVGNLGRTVPYSFSDNEDDVPVACLPAVLHCLRTRLQKTRGQLGVNLLVGGYDTFSERATLAAMHPHGSMDVITYGALGSGGLAATGILEGRYPRIGSGECTLEEGIRLAVDAVRAGVENDLGSGSQVDVCIIAKEGVLYRRAVVKEEVLERIDNRNVWNFVQKIGRYDNGGGVNGFGNIPFAVQSEKVVIDRGVLAEEARRQWLDRVLETD